MPTKPQVASQFATVFAPRLDEVVKFVQRHLTPADVFTKSELVQAVRELSSNVDPRQIFDAETLRSFATDFLAAQNPSPVATPANDYENEVRVFDCCGSAGWLIPWAHWKARKFPIVPTRNTRRGFVYLHDAASPPKTGFYADFPTCFGCVSVEPHRNALTGVVDWGSVERQLATFEDEFASPESQRLPDGVAGVVSEPGTRVRFAEGCSSEREFALSDVPNVGKTVRGLFEEFSAGRFGFVALNLAAVSCLVELLDLAAEHINDTIDDVRLDNDRREALKDLRGTAGDFRKLLGNCESILTDARLKRRLAAANLAVFTPAE